MLWVGRETPLQPAVLTNLSMQAAGWPTKLSAHNSATARSRQKEGQESGTKAGEIANKTQQQNKTKQTKQNYTNKTKHNSATARSRQREGQE